jgi:hypothetical protein
MYKTEKEIISPSGRYKAIISENKNCCSLDVYVRQEDYEHETGCVYGEYWSRKNRTPILVDKGLRAEFIAIQELRNLMGEPDLPLTIDWVRDFSFFKDARFLNPKDVKSFCQYINSESGEKKLEQIEAKTIIDFSGLCLVEEIGCEDDWQMGQMDAEGSICCWGYYGTLKEAIKGL